MTPSPHRLQCIVPPDSWNEELARAKRFREATQKRSREKLLHAELEKLKKTSQVGRIRLEP